MKDIYSMAVAQKKQEDHNSPEQKHIIPQWRYHLNDKPIEIKSTYPQIEHHVFYPAKNESGRYYNMLIICATTKDGRPIYAGYTYDQREMYLAQENVLVERSLSMFKMYIEDMQPQQHQSHRPSRARSSQWTR